MSETQLSAGASASRQPRALIQVAGTPVGGWASWEVTQPTYFEAATFGIAFAVGALPAANDAAWWLSQTSDIFLEVFAGFPQNPAQPQPSELTRLIYGRADHIEYRPAQGLIEVTGRDYAGAFIDNKLIATYENQTASQIVSALVSKRGVPVDQIAQSSGGAYVGTPTPNGQTELSVNGSEWDVICQLARDAGYVAYVTPAGLYWGEDPATQDGVSPYTITWQGGKNGAPPISNA
ncbi:MAG: hypothetical protein ACREUG_09145, partial [Steroidobacteraceae bacterium]